MAKTYKVMLKICWVCNKSNGEVKKWETRPVVVSESLIQEVCVCLECKEKWLAKHPGEEI